MIFAVLEDWYHHIVLTHSCKLVSFLHIFCIDPIGFRAKVWIVLLMCYRGRKRFVSEGDGGKLKPWGAVMVECSRWRALASTAVDYHCIYMYLRLSECYGLQHIDIFWHMYILLRHTTSYLNTTVVLWCVQSVSTFLDWWLWQAVSYWAILNHSSV